MALSLALAAPSSGLAQAPAAACCVVPAGTPVIIQLLHPVGSKISQRGERIEIRLFSPLSVNGVVVAPIGTPGAAEVIHAARSGFGGKPAELILAGRYLTLDGVQIPLGGLKLQAVGQDYSNVVLFTSLVAGPLTMFMHGSEIEIPGGTPAMAKITREVALAPYVQAGDAAPTQPQP
ncbi:hypothetical protein BH11PSE1_BH11PSE1_18660 [soil metagenome]